MISFVILLYSINIKDLKVLQDLSRFKCDFWVHYCVQACLLDNLTAPNVMKTHL